MGIPFFSLPVFYLCNEVVQVGGAECASNAYEKWKGNLLEDSTANALLWCPATFINFFLMPLHLRVPFSASVGFIWCMGMSYFRGVAQAQLSSVAQAAQAALCAFTRRRQKPSCGKLSRTLTRTGTMCLMPKSFLHSWLPLASQMHWSSAQSLKQ